MRPFRNQRTICQRRRRRRFVHAVCEHCAVCCEPAAAALVAPTYIHICACVFNCVSAYKSLVWLQRGLCACVHWLLLDKGMRPRPLTYRAMLCGVLVRRHVFVWAMRACWSWGWCGFHYWIVAVLGMVKVVLSQLVRHYYINVFFVLTYT